MNDLYNHAEIVASIQAGRGYTPLWTAICLGGMVLSDSESVGFTKQAAHMSIAPIVVPETKGIPLTSKGTETVTLMPAYTKPQYVIRHNDLVSRPPHFAPATPITKASRYRDILVTHANNLNSSVERLKDHMTAEIFIHGKVSISSANGANYSIDFNRPAANTKVLASADKWGASGVSPMDSLAAFCDTMDKPTATVVFDSEAWIKFQADPKFDKALELTTRHTDGEATFDNQNVQMPIDKSWRYLGYWASMGIELYLEKTSLPTGPGGAMQPVMAANTVVVLPAPSYGVMGYGAIQDPAADYEALPIFFKQFMDNDPALPIVQAQSAPVPFCTSTESTGLMTVA